MYFNVTLDKKKKCKMFQQLTSNKPGEQEAVKNAVKRVRLGVFLIGILLILVLGTLTKTGQVLDDAE